MNVTATPLPGVMLVEPRVFRDFRGFFIESFNADRFAQHGLPTVFRQDNHSHPLRAYCAGSTSAAAAAGQAGDRHSRRVYDWSSDVRRWSPTFESGSAPC